MTNYQPKITYIVAQKKNNVRLFKEKVDNPRDANVPAGEHARKRKLPLGGDAHEGCWRHKDAEIQM